MVDERPIGEGFGVKELKGAAESVVPRGMERKIPVILTEATLKG